MRTLLEELGKDKSYIFNTSLFLPIANERKAIAMGYLVDTEERTSAEMRGILKNHVDETTYKTHHSHALDDYCSGVFLPCGMVTKGKRGDGAYYRLTKAGEFYQPLARFALLSAVENECSLSKFFWRNSA